MSSPRPLIVGNWKMHGLQADARALSAGLAARYRARDNRFDMLLCPPATLVGFVVDIVAGSGLIVGGQDCHRAEKGAHTGDVSAWMLRDLGARAVILGHCERRGDHGEVDAVVKDKAQAAQAAGLIAVICVGETGVERDRGETLSAVCGQVRGSLPAGSTAANCAIAYEPVWAIGAGRTPSADEVAKVHGEIHTAVRGIIGEDAAAGLRVLYGGSVKPGNAGEFLGLTKVDGALVGGASLNADDFWAIAEAAR